MLVSGRVDGDRLFLEPENNTSGGGSAQKNACGLVVLSLYYHFNCHLQYRNKDYSMLFHSGDFYERTITMGGVFTLKTVF